MTFPKTAAKIRSVNYWLVKQEPEDYDWATFVKEGRTAWTGVRNFQARNNLRAMKRGDLVLFYHSVSEKRIIGIARVKKEAYADPSATEGDWVCVDLVPVRVMNQPVTLETLKREQSLQNLKLLRQTRLSVTPVSEAEFDRILRLGETKRP